MASTDRQENALRDYRDSFRHAHGYNSEGARPGDVLMFPREPMIIYHVGKVDSHPREGHPRISGTYMHIVPDVEVRGGGWCMDDTQAGMNRVKKLEDTAREAFLDALGRGSGQETRFYDIPQK